MFGAFQHELRMQEMLGFFLYRISGFKAPKDLLREKAIPGDLGNSCLIQFRRIDVLRFVVFWNEDDETNSAEDEGGNNDW